MEFLLEEETGTIVGIAQEISSLNKFGREGLHSLSIASDWPGYLYTDYSELWMHIMLIPLNGPHQTEKPCNVLGSYELKTLCSLETFEDEKNFVGKKTSAALSWPKII